MSINKAIIQGNLTRDVEMRYTSNGTAAASFSIACNRKYKQGDDTKEEVSFLDVVAWGKTAELCAQYLVKGSGVIIDGRLQQRRWDDKDTGQKRSKVEIVAEQVHFVGKRKEGKEGAPEVDEGEIPF